MKIKPISIDANIIIRLFINDIPAQSDLAVNCIETHKSVSVSDIAIIESIYALNKYYYLSRDRCAECVIALIENPKIRCNYDIFIQALKLYVKQPKLSIEDCYMSIWAKANGADCLYTFDKKLAHQVENCQLLD
ncbi:MAG: PIN domain-containing protein [Candidatus Saccharibacteria bacterium]